MLSWKRFDPAQLKEVRIRLVCQSLKEWSEFLKKVVITCPPLGVMQLASQESLIFECTFPPNANVFTLANLVPTLEVYIPDADVSVPLMPKETSMHRPDDQDTLELSEHSSQSDSGEEEEMEEESVTAATPLAPLQQLTTMKTDQVRLNDLKKLNLFAKSPAVKAVRFQKTPNTVSKKQKQ